MSLSPTGQATLHNTKKQEDAAKGIRVFGLTPFLLMSEYVDPNGKWKKIVEGLDYPGGVIVQTHFIIENSDGAIAATTSMTTVTGVDLESEYNSSGVLVGRKLV